MTSYEKSILTKPLSNVPTILHRGKPIQNDLRLELCRYLCGDRGETVVVVMDNVGQARPSTTAHSVSASLWFMKKTRTFVILQMRDETYERYKNPTPIGHVS